MKGVVAMKRIISLFFICIIFFCVGCQIKGATSTDQNKEEYIRVIKEDMLNNATAKTDCCRGKTILRIPLVNVIQIQESTRGKEVYVVTYYGEYNYVNNQTTRETGYSIPMRYDFDNKGHIVNRVIPKDGSLFASSIMEMVHEDRGLANKLMTERISNEMIETALSAEIKQIKSN